MKLLKYHCGCSFPIKKEFSDGSFPLLELNYQDIHNKMEQCPAVWSIFEKGLTNGVFQLDSGLGKHYCKQLRPTSIEHLGALCAALRPGTLNSLDENGKNLTSKYCDRKNGRESIEYQFPPLEPILKETFGILLFQEQQLSIAKDICGFSMSDADTYIRSGIAKKKPEILTKAENMFVEGAIKIGKISKQDAIDIFQWLKNAARYSFNKCLHPKSRVFIQYDNGFEDYQFISKVKVGQKVRIPNKNSEFYGWAKVLDVINHGWQELYEVIFDNDYSIICTLRHKFLTSEGFVTPLFNIISNGWSVNSQFGPTKVSSFRFHSNTIDSFDLEIDSPEHIFFVDGFAVSNSHSTLYGIKSACEAFLKVHFPLHFITSKLKSPRNSFTAVDACEMIYEAKTHFGIETKLPILLDCQETFYNDGKAIFFGLTNVRSYGTSAFKRMKEIFPTFKGFKSESPWFDFVINANRYLTESGSLLLIEAGALDFMNMSRTEMLEEYKLVSGLTTTEKDKLWKYYDCMEAGVNIGGYKQESLF